MINLMHGDCLKLMKNIPDSSIDMILTDLPYGTTQCKWDSVINLDELWKQYERITTDTAAIVLTSMQPFTSKLVMSNLKLFRYEWIYEKGAATGFLNANKQPLRAHESILVFYKKQPVYNPQKTFGHERKKSKRKDVNSECYGKAISLIEYDSTSRYPRSIQFFSSDKQKTNLHPTQKPVALMEYLIKTYTNEGMTVLDNTMGSGTTGVACIRTGRKFIGIEKDQEYFDIAIRRLKETEESLSFTTLNIFKEARA